MKNNNSVLENIKSRRSIRKYTDEAISADTLHDLLEAGFCAPSAMNRRPFHFMAVTDREIIEKLPTIQPYTKMATQAPMVLFVCGDFSLSGEFYMDDCAAATQNILLAATSLGIGSCWCGVAHTASQAAFAELLKLPENILPYSLIVLGHPAEEEKPARERFEEERVHNNKW